MGLTGNVKNKRQIDHLIEAYINALGVEDEPQNYAELAIIPDKAVLEAHRMFVQFT